VIVPVTSTGLLDGRSVAGAGALGAGPGLDGALELGSAKEAGALEAGAAAAVLSNVLGRLDCEAVLVAPLEQPTAVAPTTVTAVRRLRIR
jgi:hypothetical protein